MTHLILAVLVIVQSSGLMQGLQQVGQTRWLELEGHGIMPTGYLLECHYRLF